MAKTRAATPGVSGRPSPFATPDAAHLSLFELLFSDAAERHGYDALASRDPVADAYTPDRATNVWRAWRAARSHLTNDRPLQAFNTLLTSVKRFPIDLRSAHVGEVERVALLGECLAAGNNLVEALDYTFSARAALRELCCRLAAEPLVCAREIRAMLAVLAGGRPADSPVDTGLLGAWALTRGVDLACSLAQRLCRLPRTDQSDPDTLARDLESDIMLIERSTGLTLPPVTRAKVEFALGDVRPEEAPERAFRHFEAVAEGLGLEQSLGLPAAVNAANCLLHRSLRRCGRALCVTGVLAGRPRRSTWCGSGQDRRMRCQLEAAAGPGRSAISRRGH